jgi:hypothetical protein
MLGQEIARPRGTSDRVREQSHKREMQAAIAGDFARLRERQEREAAPPAARVDPPPGEPPPAPPPQPAPGPSPEPSPPVPTPEPSPVPEPAPSPPVPEPAPSPPPVEPDAPEPPAGRSWLRSLFRR